MGHPSPSTMEKCSINGNKFKEGLFCIIMAIRFRGRHKVEESITPEVEDCNCAGWVLAVDVVEALAALTWFEKLTVAVGDDDTNLEAVRDSVFETKMSGAVSIEEDCSTIGCVRNVCSPWSGNCHM